MPRENTEKLLDMVTEGLFDETILIRDLLNFLDDSDVGEFMSQYGYNIGDYEDEEEEEEETDELEDWRDLHGLDPMNDIEFEDSEDT